MKRVFFVNLLFLTMLLMGCASMLEEGGFLTPQPERSKYFETTSAGFIMDTNESDLNIRYCLDLKTKKKFTNGAFLEIYFENPEDKQNPIFITKTIMSNDEGVNIESPKIHGLKSYEGYVVVVKIYDSEEKKIFLGEHRQVIQSIIDTAKVLKMRE